jgi:hypothetical protein
LLQVLLDALELSGVTKNMLLVSKTTQPILCCSCCHICYITAHSCCYLPVVTLQVLLDTLELSGAIKKTPVVVGNCTGFAVNRVFFPYTMAACLLMDSGVNPYQVRTGFDCHAATFDTRRLTSRCMCSLVVYAL